MLKSEIVHLGKRPDCHEIDKCDVGSSILRSMEVFTMRTAFELYTKATDKRKSGRTRPGNTERGENQHGWAFQNGKKRTPESHESSLG